VNTLHNHSQRRRLDKHLAKVLRHPVKRKHFFDELIDASLRWSSPLRSMPIRRDEQISVFSKNAM